MPEDSSLQLVNICYYKQTQNGEKLFCPV